MLLFYSILFLVIYTILVVIIGLKNSHYSTNSDYFLASRKLPSWLLAITFIASWWGGGSAIDLVDHAYTEGLASYWIYGIPVLLSTFIMYLFAGRIRRLSLLSQPELFSKRYNQFSGLCLTLFILVFMIIGAAVQIIVIGHFFQSFFHLSYFLSAILGTTIVLFYSMFGGFKGVVLTDFLQFLFFLIGGVALFLYAYNQSGGWAQVVEYAQRTKQTDYTSFWVHAPDYFVYILTFGTSWSIQANVWQRIAASKSEKSAKKMMLISFFAYIPLYLMVTLTGMFSAVIYDSIPTGGIVAHIITQLNNPIISALIFVGLCSAIMSTMDSMFNTGALSLSVDIYQKYINPAASSHRKIQVARFSTFLMAFFSLLIALQIESVLTISWIGADFLATGAFVPLIGGFIWKKGTSKGALVSMIFGFLFSMYNLFVALGVSWPVAWEIASVEQAIIGMMISFVLYTLVSWVDHYTKR